MPDDPSLVATLPPPGQVTMEDRVRLLEEANRMLCDVICEAAPLAWVADGDADAAHRWERRAVAVMKLAEVRPSGD